MRLLSYVINVDIPFFVGDGVHALRAFSRGTVIMPFHTTFYLLDDVSGVGPVLALVAAKDCWPILGDSSRILHARNNLAVKLQTTQVPSQANVELKSEIVPIPCEVDASELKLYHVVASRYCGWGRIGFAPHACVVANVSKRSHS